MKTYIITANWGHGGPGSIASDLYTTLLSEGHECRFAYGRESIPHEVNSYKIGNKLSMYFHIAISRLFDNAGFLSSFATKYLIKDIKLYSPDVISIQNPLGYVLNVETLLSFIRNEKIPTFWTLHDCWSFTGHCTTELCDRLNNGCGECPHRLDFPKSLFYDGSARNLRRKQNVFSNIPSLQLIAPSQWIANLAAKSYMQQYPIHVINNGIDLTQFKPTPSDLRDKYSINNKRVILAVASVWSSRKGSNYIYRIADTINDEYVIIMIGKNNDAELINYSNIIHIEKTSDRLELAKWYTLADVFINPTIGDNFPTVNLEALACGTPIITFDTGGSSEAVGDCGYVVSQGDTNAMIKAIYKCFNEHISSEQCVDRAQRYNKVDRYKDYINLFMSYI